MDNGTLPRQNFAYLPSESLTAIGMNFQERRWFQAGPVEQLCSATTQAAHGVFARKHYGTP